MDLAGAMAEKSNDRAQRKKRRRHELAINERVEIVHEVVVGLASQKEVAEGHNISPLLVNQLVRSTRNCRKFFDELRAKEAAGAEKKKELVLASKQLLQEDGHIWKVAQVQERVLENSGRKISLQYVRKAFRQRLGLRYKKVKKIPFQGNSERSLVLRQQFAIKLLGILDAGKRILNIDETWLNTTDFRSRKWRVRGTTNSVASRNIQPRISLIVAVDTEGEVYISLTQVNTDSHVKQLFLSHLSSQLDRDRPDWRHNTVVLMDGATYNTAPETQSHMQRLGMPFIFTAPYSYDASPCELFFAHFKSSLLIPPELPTGKK